MRLDFTSTSSNWSSAAGHGSSLTSVLSGVAAAIATSPAPGRALTRRTLLPADGRRWVPEALIPAEYGGNEFSSLAFVLATEELARVDVNAPTALLATGLGAAADHPLRHPGAEGALLPVHRRPTAAGRVGFSEVTGGANYRLRRPEVRRQTFARSTATRG